jgi:nitroimidazol reductase NimA-like FMN-containing flavoprotein (pyridoxamine 5'-phosphate oxidase superfamily)
MPREIPVTDGFPPSERTRVRRLPERGHYERADIYPVVDAALTCTVAYILDGRPHATATAHWRDGDRLYWHGSAASRFLKTVVGTEVSVSIHLTDGIVLARSGFDSSFNYRSATLFGICEEITGEEKVAQLDAFVDKLVPGRTAELRASTEQELKATTLLGMTITEASGKIRTGGVHDNPDDSNEKVWAGVLGVETRFTDLTPDDETPVLVEPAESVRRLLGKVI